MASGALQDEPVVQALLKSYLCKAAKLANGAVSRPNTGKFFSPELAMELLIVLGNTKESRSLLELPSWCLVSFLLVSLK